MNRLFRFRIAFQTMKDNWKITAILTLLFIGIAILYTGFYPAFKDSLSEIASSMKDQMTFIRGYENMATYVGYLNMEMYQIFWTLILGILIGFISASLISKEVEAKTIDLFMSNPVSRKQIVLEKFLGLIPMILLINFVTMFAVYGITLAINEDINFVNLFMTHVVSIPYLLAVAGMGLLVSVIIDEKMKASIIMIALIIGMFIFESISLMIPDYESIGLISLTHYFNPAKTLLEGKVDVIGVVVLLVVMVQCLVIAMLYFEHRDITV